MPQPRAGVRLMMPLLGESSTSSASQSMSGTSLERCSSTGTDPCSNLALETVSSPGQRLSRAQLLDLLCLLQGHPRPWRAQAKIPPVCCAGQALGSKTS